MQYFAKSTLLLVLLFISSFLVAQDAVSYFNQGKKLKEQKKSREAMEQFKNAILAKPDYTEALYEFGWCQNDLKDYNGALTTLRRVRNDWPGIPKVHFEIGYAFEKTEQFDSAKSAYSTCIKFNKGYSGAYRQLGYLAYNNDEYSSALDYFRAYELNAKIPITDYLYWYRKGFMLNAIKQYDSAKVALLKSVGFKKDFPNTFYELGYAATRLKQAEEAINYFNSGMLLEPKSHIPYNGIGEVYRDVKKDMDMAMSWYSKTLQLNSNERKANFGMGYCMNAKGRMAEAVPYLRKAIAAEQTYTAAYVELGYSLYKTKNYSEAITVLQQANSMNPQNENALYYLVSLYVEQKDKTNAQKWLNALRKLNSRHVATLEPKVNAL